MRVNRLWVKYLRSSRHQLCFSSKLRQVTQPMPGFKQRDGRVSSTLTAVCLSHGGSMCVWSWRIVVCVSVKLLDNAIVLLRGAKSHVIANYGSAGLGLMCTLAPPLFCSNPLTNWRVIHYMLPHRWQPHCSCLRCTLDKHFQSLHVSPFDSTPCHMRCKKQRSNRPLT